MIKRNIEKARSFTSDFIYWFRSKHLAQIISIGFILAVILPNLSPSLVSANGQVQSRSITMSSSSAAASNATTSYYVHFFPTGTTNIGGIVVDFCSNDPIIGDACTAPTGFSLGASPTISALTGVSGSWAATTNGSSPYNTLYVEDTTPQATTGSGTAVTFTISNVQNPTTSCNAANNPCAFFARIITYDNHTDASSYTSSGQSVTGEVDYGGIALSTVNQITITAKVQEVLTFCVYTATYDGAGGPCSAATGTGVTLGNSKGVLAATQDYVDNTTKYDVLTNAYHGAVIVFTGTPPTVNGNYLSYTANPGDSGATSAMGSTAGTAYASSVGTTQFGLCTWAANGTTANLTPVAPYNNGTCSSTRDTSGTACSTYCGNATGDQGASFGFDLTNAANTSTYNTSAPLGYGSQLATVAAGGFSSGQIAFIGNINISQPAGSYVTTLTFIATGTY